MNVTTWHFNVYTLTVFVSEIFNTRFAALARTISATSTVHKYHLLSTKTFVDIIRCCKSAHVTATKQLIMSETFSLWKFGKLKFHTNLTKEGVLIDRIYRIKHTEKFNLNAPHKAPPLLTKLRKIGYSFSKDTKLTEKELYAIHSYVATRKRWLYM